MAADMAADNMTITQGLSQESLKAYPGFAYSTNYQS